MTEITGDLKQINIYGGMTNYKQFVPFILKWEGGVANDPNDKGGLTNKGITYDTYKGLCKIVYGCEPSKNHFFALTADQVGLMVKHFWDTATKNGSIESQKVSEAITSWAWGSGMGGGLRWFQQMLNKVYGLNLQVDGNIGTLTIKAINSLDQDELFRNCIKYRYERFNLIAQDPTQKGYLIGWLRRLREFAERHGELAYFESINEIDLKLKK